MMRKGMAAIGNLALAGGLGIAASVPASAAAGCGRLDGDVSASNYPWTTDANNKCGTLGANTFYTPTPGIQVYSGWVYSSSNYVESRHIATMIDGLHSGA